MNRPGATATSNYAWDSFEFSGPEDIDKVTDALLECATGEEFIDRVRTG